MPDKLGISRRMYFGYKSGRYPITDKAWRKLEVAELVAEGGSSAIVREDSGGHGATRTMNRTANEPAAVKAREVGELPITLRLTNLEEQVARLEATVATLTDLLQGQNK